MRKTTVTRTRLLKINNSYEAKSLEQQLRAVMAGEKIETSGKALIYTERKEGVRPETNIKSDRFELAQEAIDYVNKTNIAKRDAFAKAEGEAGKTTTSNGETTQGTNNQ